jgi:FixJ family two-component response regulator
MSSPNQDAGAVVLVEDDAAVREAVAFSLGVEGYQVRSYRTGKAALADEALHMCACLIVDYGLPDTNGLSLLRRLRRLGISAPAILITSNPSPRLRLRASGDHVPIVEKPLLGDALVQAVRQASALAPV